MDWLMDPDGLVKQLADDKTSEPGRKNDWIDTFDTLSPTPGMQFVACFFFSGLECRGFSLRKTIQNVDFMSSWWVRKFLCISGCFFFFFGGGVGGSSKVYHSQFSECNPLGFPLSFTGEFGPEDMVWCNFLAHEAKQPSSTLAFCVCFYSPSLFMGIPPPKKYGLIEGL